MAAEWNVLFVSTIRVRVRHVFADTSDKDWRRVEGGRLPFISTKSSPVQARSVFCISARISRVLEQRLEVFVAGTAVVFILFIQIKGMGLQQVKNKRILRRNRKKKNHTTEEQHLDGGLILKPCTIGTQILSLSCVQEVKERTHLQSTATSVLFPRLFSFILVARRKSSR